MRNAVALIVVSGLAGAACSFQKPPTPETRGGHGTSSSSASSAGGTGAGPGAGGASPTPDCSAPATPPSSGSCVDFTSDAGVELDAGLDEAGNASTTTCNPITNEGCLGTDVCGPDNGSSFYCQPAGSLPGVAVCGDCTAPGATCAAGSYCAGSAAGQALACLRMCCTDADCGTGRCDAAFLQPPLGSGVGVCVMK